MINHHRFQKLHQNCTKTAPKLHQKFTKDNSSNCVCVFMYQLTCASQKKTNQQSKLQPGKSQFKFVGNGTEPLKTWGIPRLQTCKFEIKFVGNDTESINPWGIPRLQTGKSQVKFVLILMSNEGITCDSLLAIAYMQYFSLLAKSYSHQRTPNKGHQRTPNSCFSFDRM